MIFSINNIGIIKRADVKVDGLTVISGTNNSGKTTVGKALYITKQKYFRWKNLKQDF